MAVNLRDPKTTKIVLSAVGVLAVVYVYFLSSWFPWGYQAQAKEIRTLEGRYQELSREVTRAQMVARRLPLLQQEFDLLSAHWDEAKRLLPDEREVISLLREITIAGQSSGVEFVLVKPQPAVPRPYVTEHPMQVSVRGGFHQLGSFLGQMSGMDRVVTVSGLKVEGKDPEQEGVAMEASMITSAYTLGGIDPETIEDTPEKQVKGAVKRGLNRVSGKQAKSTNAEE